MPGIVACLGVPSGSPRDMVPEVTTMRHRSDYETGAGFDRDIGAAWGWTAFPRSFAAGVNRYRHPDGSRVIWSGECVSTDGIASGADTQDGGRFAATLIEGLRRDGTAFLRRLNGLFSGVVLDHNSRTATIFNDRFGAERLYVRERARSVTVSSETKVLLRDDPSLRTLDPRGVADLVKFGSVLGDRTLFRGVTILPAGSAWIADASGATKRNRYFERQEWERLPQLAANQFLDEFTDTVRRVVPRYFDDAGRCGLSITGGLDTRMIVAGMPRDHGDVVSYTFAGPAGETLDASIGGRIARLKGIPHSVIRVQPEWLSEFPKFLDETVWITDGAAGAMHAHEIYLTRKASELAPVRVTGNFGSEVLRGMSTLNPWTPDERFLAPELSDAFAAASLDMMSPHPVSRAAFQEIPWHLFGSMAAGRSQVTFRSPYLDNEMVRLAYQMPWKPHMPQSDFMQVIRRLDARLARIPTDRAVALGHNWARRGFNRLSSYIAFKADYLDKEGLPGSAWPLDGLLNHLRGTPLLGRHKYLSYRTWFKHQWAELVDQVGKRGDTELSRYVRPEFLANMAAWHRSGRFNLVREIATVLTLDSVIRQFTVPFETTRSADNSES